MSILKKNSAAALFLCVLLTFVSFTTEASADSEIKDIKIEGNLKIEADAIISMISTIKGQSLDKERISSDIKSIFESGYFEDVIADYDKKTGTLTYKVAEKLTIRKLIIKGNKKIDREDILKEISTKEYGYLNIKKVKDDIKKLMKLYDSKGYFLADINHEVKDLSKGEVELILKIDESKKVLIKRINFLGNKVYTDAELKKVMITKEGGFFSIFTDRGTFKDEVFEHDRDVLQQYYGKKGYINAKISEPKLYISKDMKKLYLNISVEEGDQYYTGKISLDGDLIRPSEELMEIIKIKGSEIADSTKIRTDVQNLSTLYADEGYAYANVIPRPVQKKGENVVDIVFDIQKGNKVYIERINIKGNTDSRDKVIRRELAIKEGELYSFTKIKESRENLERLGYFEEVRISTPVGSSEDKMNINIEISEKSTGAFQVGAGFNSLENFQFIAQLQKRNLFGYGWDVALQANLGGRTRRFNLYWVDYWFLDSPVGFRLNAYNEDWRFIDFSLNRKGGSTTFDFSLFKKGFLRYTFSTKYGIEVLGYSNLQETVENLFGDGTLSSLSFTLSRDTRNRIFEPSEGSLLSFTTTISGGFLGGSQSFAKYTGQFKKFIPVSQSRIPLIGGSIVQFNFEMGYITPLFEDKIPLYQKFFPGGIFSIRGFELRSLGPELPIATSSDPSAFETEDFKLGGNKQIVFNLEYVFPIFTAVGLKGVVFYDMGNAFGSGEHINLLKLRKALGFGIRWISPIGPLRFEWGFPLDKKEDESTVVFDFTIGTLF